VSEVTTLKQLMIDAARYRWARENIDALVCSLDASDCEIHEISSMCDKIIDGRLPNAGAV
jgi:hypothetical protein